MEGTQSSPGTRGCSCEEWASCSVGVFFLLFLPDFSPIFPRFPNDLRVYWVFLKEFYGRFFVLC